MPSNKLELAISTLDVLIPIAKAVPVLGSRVEGSLEVAKKILEYAQVRLSWATISIYWFSHLRFPRTQGVQKNKKDTIELALEATSWAKDIANAAKGSEEDVLKLRSLEADVKSFFEYVLCHLLDRQLNDTQGPREDCLVSLREDWEVCAEGISLERETESSRCREADGAEEGVEERL
jgi:hypothetical protein